MIKIINLEEGRINGTYNLRAICSSNGTTYLDFTTGKSISNEDIKLYTKMAIEGRTLFQYDLDGKTKNTGYQVNTILDPLMFEFKPCWIASFSCPTEIQSKIGIQSRFYFDKTFISKPKSKYRVLKDNDIEIPNILLL